MTAPDDPRAMTVVLTTLPSDAHTWNLIFLQLLVEERGHRVVNLGPCTPYEMVCDMVERVRPGLVVVSSVNGHGHADALHLIRRLRGTGVGRDLPVVIGGKLGLHGRTTAAQLRSLRAAGYDATFCGPDDLPAFRRYVSHLAIAGSIGTVAAARGGADVARAHCR